MRLPRGPSTVIPSFIRFLFDPYGAFDGLTRRYGDTFFLRMPGSPGTLATGNPEGVKAVISADSNTLVPWRIKATEVLLGELSIFLQAGEAHRAVRRLLNPTFQASKLRDYGGLMRGAAEHHIAQLCAGQVVSVHTVAQDITLDIILGVLFGEVDRGRSARYHAALTARLDSIGPAILYLKLLRHRYGGVGPWARAMRMIEDLKVLLVGEIAARRASGDAGGGMLGMLLTARDVDGQPLSDDEIRSRLADMVVAGHETTAVAIAWAVYEMCRNPRTLERAAAEIDAGGETPYLEAICHETLRLHPALVFLTRMVAQPLTVLDWTVPPGVGVSLMVPVVHMNQALYPDPARFHPERFLGRTFPNNEYLPFGGGAKRCIGATFAIQEMLAALVVLLGRWRFRLARDRVVRATPRIITVAPVGGVEILLLERRRIEAPIRRAPARPEQPAGSASP